MSKKNNVNPNFYKVGGREHTEGADKGDTRSDAKTDTGTIKSSQKQGGGKEGESPKK
jgi:hypothetical protein